MKRTVTSVLAFVLLLGAGLALAGCTSISAGGGGGGASTDARTPYVGTWEMSAVTVGSTTYSGPTLDAAKATVNIVITLNADGTAVLETMGEKNSGTWKVKDAGTITITIQNSPQDLTIEGTDLVMSLTGMTVVFSKK